MSNTKRETQYSWSDLCYKIDPNLRAPEKAYVFDNGNKVFYKFRRKGNGNRKKS